MIDAGASGVELYVLATTSFPGGFSITAFPDDVDPISIDDVEPVGWEPLATGGGYYYTKAEQIKVSVTVIGGSQDDLNLQMMIQARLTMNSIIPLPDITSLTINYPDGSVASYSNGSIISGPLGRSVQSSSRYKSNTYHFSFNSATIVNLNNPTAILQTISQFL